MNTKIYENERPPIRFELATDTPVVIRLDGHNFKRVSKRFDNPVDATFRQTMIDTCYNYKRCICLYST